MSLYIFLPFLPPEKKRKWFLFFKFLPFHFLIASLDHHRFVAWVVGQFAHSNFGAVFTVYSPNNCLLYLCFSQHIFQLIFSKIRIYIFLRCTLLQILMAFLICIIFWKSTDALVSTWKSRVFMYPTTCEQTNNLMVRRISLILGKENMLEGNNGTTGFFPHRMLLK